MSYPTLYRPQANSPETTLAEAITSYTEEIRVADASVLPDPPTYLVLDGEDQAVETVLMTEKNGNTLTVQRGVEGHARSWNEGIQVSRNFTAADHGALQEWVQTLNDEKIAQQEKGAANGVAPLNAKGLLETVHLPPLGMGVDLLGMYPTLDALIAAHPEGRVRDAWVVGTPEENTIYAWDKDALTWADVGSMATSVNGLTGNINLDAGDTPYTNPALEGVENVREGIDAVWTAADEARSAAGAASSIANASKQAALAATEAAQVASTAAGTSYVNAALPASTPGTVKGVLDWSVSEIDRMPSVYAPVKAPAFTGNVQLGSTVTMSGGRQVSSYTRAYITEYIGGLGLWLRIPCTNWFMGYIHLTGNGYGDIPIDTHIQWYNYLSTGTILNARQLNSGCRLPKAVIYQNSTITENIIWIPGPIPGFASLFVENKIVVPASDSRPIQIEQGKSAPPDWGTAYPCTRYTASLTTD